MVQNGKEDASKIENDQTRNTYVKAEDVAVAAIFSAVGAATSEILKDPTARLIACASIGLCVGIYGTNMVINKLLKSREA